MGNPVAVDRPKILVIGGGFGGIEAAKALGKAGVDVTLIDRRNHHLFQPLLYQVATAALSPADIAEPIRKMLRKFPSATMVLGEVVAVDRERRLVRLADESTIAFDRLIIATGATHSYFGHHQWALFAPGLKTIEDARSIRSRVLLTFERAEAAPSVEDQRRFMTIAIIGGGPTGVEMAGSIAELARHALARDFRRIRTSTASILLIEAGPRLLSTFPEALSDYAKQRLESLGVTVMLGQAVRHIDSTGVTVGDQFIRIGAAVWAAGVSASPVARWLALEGDASGRVRVNPDLSVADGIYVIGDAALAIDRDGRPLPGLAQVAQQQGRHIGRQLAANLIRGSPITPFRFRNRGNAAIIGRHSAVFDFGDRRLTGRAAWALWAIVHIYLLTGFENRLLVAIQWLWRYLTYERGARLITPDAPQYDAGITAETCRGRVDRGS